MTSSMGKILGAHFLGGIAPMLIRNRIVKIGFAEARPASSLNFLKKAVTNGEVGTPLSF